MNIHIGNQKGSTWNELSDEDLKHIIFIDSEEW